MPKLPLDQTLISFVISEIDRQKAERALVSHPNQKKEEQK